MCTVTKEINKVYNWQKKEKNKYGDLINWKEIIRYSKTEKKNVIYVMRDLKEDWWYEYKGKKISPRVELKREFLIETGGMQFHIYSLENFISRINCVGSETVDQSVIDEVKNVLQSEKVEKNEEMNGFKLVHDTKEIKDIAPSVLLMSELSQKIRKLEKENEVRRDNIWQMDEKYKTTIMPERVIKIYEGTMRNMIKCDKKIVSLRRQYAELYKKCFGL